MIYALDTNIISYFLKGNDIVRNKFRDALADGNTIVIPPIVYYEIKRGFFLNPAPAKEKTFNAMCKKYAIGAISNSCLETGAKIFADVKARNPKDADILIAAFCLVNNYTLVTNNTKDFDDIDGLTIVDWTE